MASNMALKRAAKANRRKMVVAQKRKLEILKDTPAERVVRAASAPIRHCFVSDTLFDDGIGTMILARGITSSHLTLGVFLIDTWCLGIKDAYLRAADAETFEMMIASLDVTTPMAPVDPSYARRLLRDAAAWAASIGFAPHRDFLVVERLFGDVNCEASDASFLFGREGKPLYVPGPKESPAQIRHRIEQLRSNSNVEKFEVAEFSVGPNAELE